MLQLSKADIARSTKVKISRDELVRHGIAEPKKPVAVDHMPEILDRLKQLEVKVMQYEDLSQDLGRIIETQGQMLALIRDMIIRSDSQGAPQYRFDVMRDSDGRMTEVNAVPMVN